MRMKNVLCCIGLLSFVVWPLFGQKVAAEKTAEPAITSYRDENRTIQITLVTDMVLEKDPKDRWSLARTDADSPGRAVEAVTAGRPPDVPVFKTDTGQLLAPVGGIILVLHSSWTKGTCEKFLDIHGLLESAEPFEWLTNAYKVQADSGMASIELANRLAPLEGVVISASNFWREI